MLSPHPSEERPNIGFIRKNASFRASKRWKPKEETIGLPLQIHNIRLRLEQQLRCLDQKLECQSSMVLEIQDFFKRRSEVELDYSQKLDKLAKQFMARQKADKQKREPWAIFSTFTCWQHLLGITRQESKDHSVLADVFGNNMYTRLSDITDDCRRMYSKCKEIAMDCQGEIVKVLNELQSDMKQYHVFHAQAMQSESKLRHTEEQKHKVEQQATKGSKKLKAIDKQLEKRQDKYTESKLKALKARNEYLLSIDAANAATHKYFVDDLSLLIDCMDFGYHNSLQRSMLQYNSCCDNLRNSYQSAIDCVVKCVQELDPNKDKQNFIKENSSYFSLPKRFEYQPHRGDEISQVSAQKPVQDDLVIRYNQLHNRLDSLKLENEEAWKSVEAVDKTLIELINVKDYDLTESFKADVPVPRPSSNPESRRRRVEMEQYYLEKFKHYLLDSNLIARLQSKHSALRKALGEDVSRSTTGAPARPPSLPPKASKPRRIGKAPIVGQPKVFGCSLEEFVEATGQSIPPVMKSCIKAINLHGMHHEGVFRVSGLQAEINELKAAFEKGEDPLADVTNANSINSIAAVLKSFFRELQEPLFPLQLFDALVEASSVEDEQQSRERIAEIISTLSHSRMIVMRYLFAFLNHLSQYSDENLMYPYNIAVCFGPTLLPIPGDKDQVAYQSNVNNLINRVIVNCEFIFPRDDSGPFYERILIDPGDRDEADGSENEHSDEDICADTDVLEAEALFDFDGRSERELSFRKGDKLLLYTQSSEDWWEGALNGKEGIIPHKYIEIKRDDALPSSSNSSSALPRLNTSSTGERPTRLRGPETNRRRSADSQPSCSSAGEESTSSGKDEVDEIKKASSQPNIAVRLCSPAAKLPSTPEHGLFELDSFNSEQLTDSSALFSMQDNDELSRLSTDLESNVTDSVFNDGEEPPEAEATVQNLEAHEPSIVEPSILEQSITGLLTTEQINRDIDCALAEVMSGLETLTASSQQSSASSTNQASALTPPPSRHTPDLVQDLPVDTSDSEPTSPVGSYAESSSVQNRFLMTKSTQSLSAAETFANSENTMVRMKTTTMPRTTEQIRFIGTSVGTACELTSFGRLQSKVPVGDGRSAISGAAHKSRRPSVTGNAIQVRIPSVPESLDLKSTDKSSTALLTASKSEPSTPNVALEDRVKPQTPNKIPPSIKPKPPSVPPKPKRDGSTVV